MLTDRGKRQSLVIFHQQLLNKNETLPDIRNKRKSHIEKVHSNKNLLLRRKSNFKIPSIESNNINNQLFQNHKNNFTERSQNYLDKKIIKLINCYKELKFSEEQKNTKFKTLSLKENNHNKDYKNINILSKSLTKAYKISEQLEKEGVKKLDEWDKNNLAQLYGNSDIIYNLLYNYYKKKENFDKIDKLNYYKSIIDSNGEEIEEIIVGNSTSNNKIIRNFLSIKVKEQTYILKNNIAKSQSKFNKSLLFVKEKKLAMTLGIDNETLAQIKKEGDKNGYNYEKVIKDKDTKEMIKKEEIISILIKIFNKKLEKSKKEKQQSENFEIINQKILKYNSKIINIQFEIDNKKELYDKLNETEYEKEKMYEKINQLATIKYESEKDQKKQEELKNELNEELKKLALIKDEINEELNICKNEIAYLKLVYINLVKCQRNYYLDLLKKGYDVRTEGLIWVVKRLLEIQTKLEYHHFPKFLDNNQIKYIIEMANLSLEETQLKTILKIIEKKREDIQNNVNNKVMNKIEELSRLKNRHRASIFTLEMEKIKNRLKDSNTEIFDTFQKIYRKYKPIFLGKIIQKEEDIKIKRIIEELKTSLMEGGGKTNPDNFQQLTGILNYLNENKESKEYLEILLLIKFRLSCIHKLRESYRNDQLNKFKLELSNNQNNRFFNAESSLRFDLVKSALFGNKI